MQCTQPLARTCGIPLIQLIEGVGHSAKTDEASGRMPASQGNGYWRLGELLGHVPVASGFMGPSAGLPAAFGLMSHFTSMVEEHAQVFPSAPPPSSSAPSAKSSAKKTSAATKCTSTRAAKSTTPPTATTSSTNSAPSSPTSRQHAPSRPPHRNR